ncbi:hypothetical protein [Roseobacter sp. CCS2]|uniref:hypothetical protein n=1 Tax=Roseobacter sp. CCS2 TaxID=391593 RepID=UPI0012EA5C0D|nr:hypothetical protein [Roseobacter sp. CCS2]
MKLSKKDQDQHEQKSEMGDGHLNPIRAFFDPKLAEFTVIYAATGTPRHIFPIYPAILVKISAA